MRSEGCAWQSLCFAEDWYCTASSKAQCAFACVYLKKSIKNPREGQPVLPVDFWRLFPFFRVSEHPDDNDHERDDHHDSDYRVDGAVDHAGCLEKKHSGADARDRDHDCKQSSEIQYHRLHQKIGSRGKGGRQGHIPWPRLTAKPASPTPGQSSPAAAPRNA